MPLIDLHCHLGPTPGAMAVRPPELSAALAYADTVSATALCFSATNAASDVRGGNATLAKALETDARLRGWLTLSVHAVELSHEVCRRYLMRSRWIGVHFECLTDTDDLDIGGGPELLNSLRRYSKPILVAVGTPRALESALQAARTLPGLRFLISPAHEDLVADALPAMREVLNTSLVPVAAHIERDLIARAADTLGERGERRIMWASDWGRFHPAAALGMLRDAGITAPQRERIAYRNALEILPGD